MKSKSKIWKAGTALVAFGMCVTTFLPDQALAATSSPQAKKSISIQSLPNQAVAGAKNILLYDANGKITNEYHSDGTVVTYTYGPNGNMTESKDNRGYIQKYLAAGDHLVISDYYKGRLIGKKHSAHAMQNANTLSLTPAARKTLAAQKENQASPFLSYSSTSITPQSTTSYADYYVSGVLMNDVAYSLPNHSVDKFEAQSTNMQQSNIQTFFENHNSILQNLVEVYKEDSYGNIVDTGYAVLPSIEIADAATNHNVNPKVIIATLQKESSLVSSSVGSVPFSSRRFYYAMGYGATDSGDISGTTGFDNQIDKGADLLYSGWLNSPTGSSSYPALFSPINGGQTASSGGVTYQDYIWLKNYGSWSLYNYTPWALDTTQLPTIGGGNYLFHQIFSGYWGSNWD